MNTHCGKIVGVNKHTANQRLSSLTCIADFLASPDSTECTRDFDEECEFNGNKNPEDMGAPPRMPRREQSLASINPPKMMNSAQPRRRGTTKYRKKALSAITDQSDESESSEKDCNPLGEESKESAPPSRPRRRGTTKHRRELLTITDVTNESESKKDCDPSLDLPTPSMVVSSTGTVSDARRSAPHQPRRRQTVIVEKNILTPLEELNVANEGESKKDSLDLSTPSSIVSTGIVSDARRSAPHQPRRRQTVIVEKNILTALYKEESGCSGKIEDCRAPLRIPRREDLQVSVSPSLCSGRNSALPSQSHKDCGAINPSLDLPTPSSIVTTGIVSDARRSAPHQPQRRQTVKLGKHPSIITKVDNIDQQFDYIRSPICRLTSGSKEYIAKTA